MELDAQGSYWIDAIAVNEIDKSTFYTIMSLNKNSNIGTFIKFKTYGADMEAAFVGMTLGQIVTDTASTIDAIQAYIAGS